jgi:glyoxylase-like metal-dependent hydrolase (beta-lactamase superfamily II)
MHLDRRAILGVGASLAAAPFMGSALGLGPAIAQGTGFKTFKLGALTITALHDGTAERPVADGFIKNVKLEDFKTFLANANMSTEKLTNNFSNIIVDDGKTKVMFDTLTGGNLAPTTGKLTENLKAAGIDPASINTILISHFHPDHIGGLSPKDGLAKFENAEIRVPDAEWAFWMDEARMKAAPEGMKNTFKMAMGIFERVKARVRPFKPEEVVAPGITAIAAPGHTMGHSVFSIQSDNQGMMFLADTTNNPLIFAKNPDWQVMFDMDGAMATETRKKLLDRAAAEKLIAFFYHAPFPAAGMITKNGAGYGFELMA